MSLKLRLNLIITALLFVMMFIGAWFMLSNARENVRAEIESTANLALHLLDAEIFSFAETPIGGMEATPFRLKSLSHVRHLRIEFYDVRGNLRDSNAAVSKDDEMQTTPWWFEDLMTKMSSPWAQTRRAVLFGARVIGELVVTPDPSYEIAEIWSDVKDLLGLAFVFFIAVNILVYWAVGSALRPVTNILLALESLEHGKLDTRLPTFKLSELARISIKFNRMAETLQQSIHRNLGLSKQIISLQEKERKSLARDLHDEVGQSITAIHVDAQAIVNSELNTTSAKANAKQSATAILLVAEQMMDMTHKILERLRPDALDKLGLSVALNELVSSWRPRLNGAVCVIKISGELNGLSEVVSVTVYRVVQECLTNIARYAAANRVTIGVLQEDDTIVVMVEDDGRGFDTADLTNGFGLAGMRERIEGLGGEFELDSAQGRGTHVVARLPISVRE